MTEPDNVYVGGYTDSPFFLCPGNTPPTPGVANQCTNANQGTASTDAFVVKIPASYSASSDFLTNIANGTSSALYGGFGSEVARGIAYNATSNMVYLGGDTTTAAQNFVSPNNKNLPGITNSTATQYTVASLGGGNITSGLPGPGPNARGSFIVAWDASSFIRTFATYVAVSPATGTCGGVPCNQGTDIITGIAAEGGAKLGSNANAAGNVGHIYITGNTTSVQPTSQIAKVVPLWSCTNPLAASSTPAGGPIVGPTGFPVVIPGGMTIPFGCTTTLITQAPFNINNAVVTGCPYPMRFDTTNVLTTTCNISAFVAILDGALLTTPAPTVGTPPAPLSPALPAPVGNQIEYWAYYSSTNSSTISNAIAIDTNPTTATSVYSLGTYQQMYITGSSTATGNGGGSLLPTTSNNKNTGFNSNWTTPSEIFTTYNIGTGSGGGVGAWRPAASAVQFQTDAYVARFNANGLAASTYGGQGAVVGAAPGLPAGSDAFPFMGYAPNQINVPNGPATGPNDHSFLIHTPQFNFGEFVYSNAGALDNSSLANTVGNAIAVDPTRATLIGGVTNNRNTLGSAAGTSATCAQNTSVVPCSFATTNFLGSPATGGQNAGGTDGWLSVVFFNDILTDAPNQPSANPFLTPGFPLLTSNASTAAFGTNCTAAGNCSYIETTPAPFGPTFDFAISDPATQTQTFHVLFTGQIGTGNPVQTQNSTPWYVPLDPRSGATQPTVDNNLPGSGIAYYVPCQVPSATGTLKYLDATGTLQIAPVSPGYYNNAYPAPGTGYGPLTCTAVNTDLTIGFPSPTHLYEKLPMLFSGYPGLTPTQAQGANLVTPGWLLVSQDQSAPGGGVVRLQLDRRAAAGLLEGTYVSQFLVTTLDPSHPSQWPPCGPLSSLNNPYGPASSGGGNACTNGGTPLPADNVSVLVTVRLVVRPTLFLSRNSGALTGVTSSLTANPLSGPTATITQQDGTSAVGDWFFTGVSNDTAKWDGTPGSHFGLDNIFNSGSLGPNSGFGSCTPGLVPFTTVRQREPHRSPAR